MPSLRCTPWALGAALLSAGCHHPDLCPADPCPWTQWGHDAAHAGSVCTPGQGFTKVLADVVMDPMTTQEEADDSSGSLVVHYQAPLVECGDVYVEIKGGHFAECKPPGSGSPRPCGWQGRGSQVWKERRYHWDNDSLSERWTFTSDWLPPPTYFEPMFQPALAGNFLYVPGAGGSVFQLDKESGKTLTRFEPFGPGLDATTFVASALTADSAGAVYYTALRYGRPQDADGWLVRIAPTGDIGTVVLAGLIPNAPKPTDTCYGAFTPSSPTALLPPPPNPDGTPATAPSTPCGSQRPTFNAAPTVGPDGTIFFISRAHNASRYAYLVAMNPDLSLKWAASLRGLLHDGCGTSGTPCAAGATPGVDPFTNLPPAGAAEDDSSSSPVALPDGSVLYGALTDYNGARGHLLKFGPDGTFQGSYDFGWDVTPAVYSHGGTYSIVVKDNHYFSSDGHWLTQLSPALQVEWQFRNPNGSEWCTNAPAIDSQGTVFVTSEDGNLYAIPQGGGSPHTFFLQMALSAAYTPTTIDSGGRIYAMNAGHLQVLGTPAK